jgi:hypothetical protein
MYLVRLLSGKVRNWLVTSPPTEGFASQHRGPHQHTVVLVLACDRDCSKKNDCARAFIQSGSGFWHIYAKYPSQISSGEMLLRGGGAAYKNASHMCPHLPEVMLLCSKALSRDIPLFASL